MLKTRQKQYTSMLKALLVCAFVLRLALAFATDGYGPDMSCFVGWGSRLAEVGPAEFYSDDYFCDYPPGYIWVLGLVGAVRAAFDIAYESGMTYLLLAVVPAICDCAAAWLIYRVGAKYLPSQRAALMLAAFAAFSPLMLFDTGIWKQIDGALALPLLLCFWLLEQRRYLPAALAYGVALAVKPQALLFGPVLAACYLAAIWLEKDKARAFGRCFLGAAIALAPTLVLSVPFFGAGELFASLLEKYFGTASSYPYASINAFNWLDALGGNWVALTSELLPGVTWRALGVTGIIIVTALLAFFTVKSIKKDTYPPLLLAAFYGLGIFTLAHCMHERYMVPGVLLALLAAARWGDLRLYLTAFGMSFTGFINLATVYAQAGGDDQFLTSATSASVVRIVGLTETAFFIVLLWCVFDIAVRGRVKELPALADSGDKALTAPSEPQPKWQKRELIAIAALTAFVAALSFARLGSLTAPQNPLDATGVTLTETVTPAADATALWVYPGISYGGTLRVENARGEVIFEKELSYATCFSWTDNAVSVSAGEQLTITVENAQMFELALRGAGGELVAVEGGGALFDEQQAVPDVISEQNSMYFDEIYHARTAYEFLHKLPVYETTHPPLGKDLIAIGIAIFGMTAFGWRFMGTLFGVMLVPLAWCFTRRLTRRPWAGALAGALLALDLMRYAQSRLATIDTYGTFFILLGAYFMLWYCQSVLQKGVKNSIVPMALGGAAFGLGCASKWTGIYAGAGLAVLYFLVLYLRYKQKKPGFGGEVSAALVGGVTFYVVVPLCIYALSYLPYKLRDSSFGLSDLWRCQVTMYTYHSQLEATHPFASSWYTWLLGLRPVWYYQNTYLAEGLKASIACIAGPVICVTGLCCIMRLLWLQCSGRGTRGGACVLILYGAQLIPWMLVPRCTFLYHYFPSSMFCLAAIVYTLAQMRDEASARFRAKLLLAASAVVFVLYYPAISAVPVPLWWTDMLQILPSFGFY